MNHIFASAPPRPPRLKIGWIVISLLLSPLVGFLPARAQPSNYCPSGATSADSSHIYSFALGNISTVSSDCASYTDYTGSSTTVTTGETVDFNLVLGSCQSDTTGRYRKVKIYVDWNQDGEFDEAEGQELTTRDEPLNPRISFASQLAIPDEATPGTTLLRIVCWEDSRNGPEYPENVGACAEYAYGETEDYSLTVQAPPPPADPVVAKAGEDQTLAGTKKDGSAVADLDGTASTGPIVSYRWTEGSTVLAENNNKPRVTLPPGEHVIVLTVADAQGNTDQDALVITVTSPLPPADPVVAKAGQDQRVLSTEEDGSALVTLDGTASTGPIVSYRWTEKKKVVGENAEPEVPLSVGTHKITLTVADEEGNTDSDEVLILVNQPPQANAGPDQRITTKDNGKPIKVNLDASASSDNGGSIKTYTWTWDGQTVEGRNPNVSLSVGTFTITLTVTDDQGATDTDEVTIIILPPAATPPPGFALSATAVTAEEDFTGTQTVKITSEDGTPSASYSFSPPLSSIDFARVVYDPAENEIGIAALPDAAGEVSINVIATDRSNPDNIAQETLTLTVRGVNDPPIKLSNPLPLSVRQDSEPKSIDLSEFFSDADEDDELIYTSQSSNTDLVIPTIEGNTLVLTIAAGQTGEATVTVSATDEESAPVSTSFTVTVLSTSTNLPPVADAGQDIQVMDEDGDGQVDVPLNGAGSQDEDDKISQYLWTWDTKSALGKTPKITLSEGETSVILTVTDERGGTSSDTVMVSVLKTTNVPLQYEQAKQLGGPGVVNMANSAVDDEGSLYLLGVFSGIIDFDPTATSNLLNGGRDGEFFVAKYASDGTLVFVNVIEVNASFGESYPENLTLDADHNLFVAASFVGDISLGSTTLTSTDNSRDIMLARYNADGTLSFAHRLGGSGTDYGHSLATTPDNKILLMGRFQDEVDFDPGVAEARRQAENWDIYLARFTPEGVLEQVTSFGGEDFQTANRMVVDAQGNIIIAGSYKNRITLDEAYVHEGTRNGFLATLSPDLTIQSSLPFLTPENPVNEPPTVSMFIHTDEDDNVVVAGSFTGRLEVGAQEAESPGGEDNIFITKLQPDLSMNFFREYGGAYSERATDILMKADGHFLMVGTFDNELDLDRSVSTDNFSSIGEVNGFLATLDSVGNVEEVRHIKGESDVSPKQLFWESDDRSSVMLTGTFKENVTLDDGTVLRSLGALDIFVVRLLLGVDQVSPLIEATFPRELIVRSANSLNLSVRATDANGIQTSQFGYVGLSSPDTITLEPIEPQGDLYQKTMEASQLLGEDSLGIRYRFVFTDAAGNASETSGVTYWQYEPTAFGSTQTPAGPWREIGNRPSAELSIADFNILAFPFEAQPANRVLAALGTPTDSLWRLFRYDANSGTFPEYGVDDRFLLDDRFEPGQGYFLITRDRSNVQFGGTVDSLNTTGEQYYHTFTLTPGWNLIGNPFPFAIDWQQVINSPLNRAIQDDLATQQLNRLPYGEEEDDYYTSSQLGAFEGAFFNWEGPNRQTLFVPPTARLYNSSNENGRRADAESRSGWEITLALEQGTFRSGRAGVGMHPAARESTDWHDALSVPKPVGQPELRINHSEAVMNRSVVPEQDHHHWSGQVVGTPGRTGSLRWDASAVRRLNYGLYLWDSIHSRLITLAEQDVYRFTMPASGMLPVQVYYGSPERLSEVFRMPSALVGTPYPNPASQSLKVPLILPAEARSPAPVVVTLYNQQSSAVATRQFHGLSAGYQELAVELEGLRRGLYYCQIRVPGDAPLMITKKILKE